jgi:hypothetical protein
MYNAKRLVRECECKATGAGLCMQSDWRWKFLHVQSRCGLKRRRVHAERLTLNTHACAEQTEWRWHVHAERLALNTYAGAEQNEWRWHVHAKRLALNTSACAGELCACTAIGAANLRMCRAGAYRAT